MPEAGSALGSAITRLDKFLFCLNQCERGFSLAHSLTPDHAEKVPQCTTVTGIHTAKHLHRKCERRARPVNWLQ